MAHPYLGLSNRVEAAGVEVAASEMVGKLSVGHLFAEVRVFGNQMFSFETATEDDGGWADLGKEESVEEGTRLETHRQEMEMCREGSKGHTCPSDLDRAVTRPAWREGKHIPGLSPIHWHQLRGGGKVLSSHQQEAILQHCTSVAHSVIDGVSIKEPSSLGQLVAGMTIAGHGVTLDDIHCGGGRAIKAGDGALAPAEPHV